MAYRDPDESCPDCARRLERVTVLGIERLACTACLGRFVGKQELGTMAEVLGVAPERLELHGIPLGPGKRTCPTCGTVIEELRLPDYKVVALCKGHGVWFAAGVLESVLDRAQDITAPLFQSGPGSVPLIFYF